MPRGGTAAITYAQLVRVRDPERRVAAAAGILEELRVLEARVSAVRDAAMAELHLAGVSYQHIADAAGLTRGRVAQIVRAARGG